MLGMSVIVALCSLGDVDGDRVPDLAILGSERLHVVSMSEHRTLLAIEPPSAPPGRSRNLSGIAAAAVDDLDGDGKRDLAVAWGVRENGGWSQIRVHSTRDGRVLWSTEDRWSFDCVLAAPGDLDGDGSPDLLVGVPGSTLSTGSVEALSGKDGRRIHLVLGEFRWSRFGSSIAPLGDLDGDGRPDYAVGAPGPGNSGPDQQGPRPFDAEHRFGTVHFVSGATGKRIRILYGARWIAENGQGFGSVIASGGDFDRDGVQDLVVGQGDGGFAGAREQRVLVLSGKSGLPLLEIDREGSASDLYGQTLAVLADGTGDGIPEILVGAPEWNLGDRAGELGYAEDVGAVDIVNGADGSSIRIWTGGSAFERLGQQLARVGDLACIASSEGVVLACWRAGTILGSIHLDSLAESSRK